MVSETGAAWWDRRDKARWKPPREGIQLPHPRFCFKEQQNYREMTTNSAKLRENFWVFQKQWFFCALLELHFWGKPTAVCVQEQKEEKEKHVLIPGEMNRICIKMSFINHWFMYQYVWLTMNWYQLIIT